MSDYYEDTSYYCYTVPAHYDDTPANPSHQDYSSSYDDETQAHPYSLTSSYHDDITPPDSFDHDNYPIYEDSHHQLDEYFTPLVELYHEDEIHPAYRDHPVDSVYEDLTWPIQPPTTYTTTNEPSHDHTEPVHPPINNYDELDFTCYSDFTCYLDEELIQNAQFYEELLQEMIDWDVEDAENKALGRIVPGSNPPDEPYQDSDDFKRNVQSRERIRAVQRWRIEQDVKGIEDEFIEDVIHLPAHPQSIPSLHPTPIFHITTTKHRGPRYYFGSPLRRRRHQNKIRTTSPPYIQLPRPHPFSPNIHTRSHRHSHPYHRHPDIVTLKPPPSKPNIPSYQQPRHPPHIRPRRKHPPVSPSPRQNVDRRHNAIRRISKRCSRMNIT
jgi:hypothetical protein